MRAISIGAAVAAVLALLAGLTWYWLDTRSSGETDAAGTPFQVIDAADRSLDGAPALALSFSLPLDARTSYENHLQVFEMPGAQPAAREDGDEETRGGATVVSTAPADTDVSGGTALRGAWVVGENPRLIYFPHIKPQTRYVVRVAAGLPAKAGATLPAEARYAITTAAVPPGYYFASNGTVLPARQNGGLPVVTVNVPEVDIQFLRVRGDQLPRFLDRVISSRRTPAQAEESASEEEEGDHDWLRSSLRGAVYVDQLDDLRKLSESVYAGRFVTESRPNRRSVTHIPVEEIKELQEPGIYVAVMSQPGRFRYEFQTTYFYVSDLGLHLRRFERGAHVFVSSLTGGKAVKGVDISWLDARGKVLAHAQTDGDGHVAFSEQPKDARVVLARKDKQVSMLALKEPALDLSEFEAVGAPYKPVRLFAWSGRNLYRPGEHFDVSVLLRDADGRPVPAQPIQAVLKRPDGRAQFTANWLPNERFPGYLNRRIEMPADAPTGFWSLELRNDPADKVAGTVFRFGVEEFLPERMKLDLESKQPVLEPRQDFVLALHGSYLYGAPAAGNRLLGVVQFERARNPLARQYPGFEFGDVSEDQAKAREELPEQALDQDGRARVDIGLQALAQRRSPFTVRATFSLLESGGRPVVRSIERVLWPAPTLVAVRPLFQGQYAKENSPVDFEVIRVDREGTIKPAAAMPVRLFRENREYYWRFEDQRGWHSGFTETDELVETAVVDVPAGGRGKLRVPVRYGRYRLEITDPQTGLQSAYRFYAGWSARADESQGVRPDRVGMKLDKPVYREGETVKLTITPPHRGEALIAVEGDRMLWMKRVSISGTESTVEIPFQAEWKRHDLYVSAMVLRPGSEGDRVTPARALGIVHLPLARGERKLEVGLEAPQKVLPETTTRVKVRVPQAKGRQAIVTLSAVDVGILNITRFATPDPHGFYFGKLRYGADQHDIYGRLIEKMQGQKGKLRFGGDDTPKPTRSLPKKVRLVDLFSGPVQLNEQGEAEIALALPDFNGTLRLMAVVAEAERFGSAEAEMTVAAPLVAEIATPRFLSFGDKATIALDLHNLSGSPQQLKVSIEGGAALQFGEGERSLSLKDQERRTLRFAVEARAQPGLHPIVLQVSGGGHALRRSFMLSVQAPTPQQQFRRRYTIRPGETLELRDAELSGLHPASVLAHLALSNQPPIDVRAALQGLLSYPYGCAEQTTSSAYPHLFIDEDAARRFGLKPYTREERGEMVERSLARLAAMQAPNGGFSLWGNASEFEYWLTAYVSAFMQDAREQGFAVPDAMLSRARDFLLRGLQDGVARLPAQAAPAPASEIWREDRVRDNGRFGVLAYGAYVLARESRAPLSTLRQLHELRGHAHSGLPLVQLGLALQLMGDGERARVAMQEGVRKGRDDRHWWSDYGSPLRDAALSYALLERHRVEIEGRENLLALITAEMDKQRYYSTQEKLALFLVGRGHGDGGKPWNAEFVSAAGSQQLTAADTVFRELAAAELGAGVRIYNKHSEALYAELALSGNPVRQPAPKSDPITLARAFFAPDGSPIGARPLRVGESVLVRLTVTSKTPIATGLVVDRIAAGLEIENTNIVQGEQMAAVNIGGVNPAQAMNDVRIKHVEFRDDRFVAAARLDRQPLILFYRARVVTPGRFVVPPLHAEDMYRPDLFGLTGLGEALTVTDTPVGDGAR